MQWGSDPGDRVRTGQGFRSTGYLITMVYLIAAKPDLSLPALAAAHTK